MVTNCSASLWMIAIGYKAIVSHNFGITMFLDASRLRFWLNGNWP